MVQDTSEGTIHIKCHLNMSSLGLQLLASLEKAFAESKALHFKGTVRVRLSQLDFPWPIRGSSSFASLPNSSNCGMPRIMNVLQTPEIRSLGFGISSLLSPDHASMYTFLGVDATR